MSLGFLGIQMGFAQQNANVCCILQTFAAAVKHLSPFWLLAPVTGMLAGDKKKTPQSRHGRLWGAFPNSTSKN